MIINNHQSPFNYQLDEVNTNTNTFNSPRTPSTTLSDFNSNITKYRNFKQDIHRINNIDNEINFIKSNNNNNYGTSVNFFKTLRISKEDYDESIAVSNDIIERLTDDEIADVISHRKLLSFQRNVMEIFCYFIGYDYFDWKMIRDKLTLYDAKIKMNKIDYNKLDYKRVNLFLNKICRNNKGIINGLPQNVCTDYGMDLIYDWVRAQIKIYLYLYQNNNNNNSNNNVSYCCSNTKNNNNNKSNNNDEQNSITQYNQTHSTFKGKISPMLSHTPSSKHKAHPHINNNSKSNSNNNIYRIVFDSNSSSSKHHRVGCVTGDSLLNDNDCNNNMFIQSKQNFYTKRKHNNVEQCANASSSIVGGGDNSEHKNEFLLTALPELNRTTSSCRKDKGVNVFDVVSGMKRCDIKENYLYLYGFDHDKDHQRKEERFFENLPFLKYRTFRQMREYFNLKSKINKRIEQKHFDDIKTNSLSEGKNKNKIIGLIAQKKISVLNNIPLYKLQQILSDNTDTNSNTNINSNNNK